MDYLLKSSLLVIILVGFYYFFLRNETFFKSIRTYLIGGLFIATLFPLIEIPIYVETLAEDLSAYTFTSVDSEAINPTTFNWINIAIGVYLIGVVFLVIKLLIQFASLSVFLKKNSIHKEGNYNLVRTSQSIAPFSFFNTIVYNPNQFSEDELQLIVSHEKAHAEQMHSIDTILSHLLVILLWFNPFAWILKKVVQQNLEFLADAHVTSTSENSQLYKLTLLKTCTTPLCTDISNNFYNSIIKNRIIMLQKNPSRKRNQYKYALLLPILAVFLMTFNTKTIAQEKKQKEKGHNELHFSAMKVELLIDKNTTAETLKSETETFEKEFNVKLTFKSVKRNSQGEITGIKIAAKSENSSTSYAVSGDTPIKPVQISYDSDSNNLSIGKASELHENYFTYKIKDKDGNISIKNGSKEKGNFIFIKEDGEKISWTVDGDGKSDKDANVFVVKSDDNVWVEKDGGKKIIIKEINEGDASEGNHNIILKEVKEHDGDSKNVVVEIITEGDEDQQVIIISEDGKGKQKVKKKGNMVFFGNSGDAPLYIIDGKESSKETMENLSPEGIESMNVLKGESAEKKYGKKGKNGVIEIKTKKN